jgi:hypothetical protein
MNVKRPKKPRARRGKIEEEKNKEEGTKRQHVKE